MLVAIGIVVGLSAGFVIVLRQPASPLWSSESSGRLAAAHPTEQPSTRPPEADPSARDASARVDAILDRVSTLRRDGKLAEVIAVLQAAIAENVGIQRLHVALAEAMLESGRPNDAYEQYVQALASGERTPALEFQSGTVASSIGRNDRAMEHFAAAQAQDQSNPEYPLFLGQTALLMGKVSEARAALARSLRLKDDDARAWGALAEVSLRENALDSALQQVRRARQLDPRGTVYRFIEARVHVRANRPAEAAELLLPLDAPEREAEPIARLLADALTMTGRGDEAARVLAASSDRQPNNAALARDALVRAERAGLNELVERLRVRTETGNP